MITGKCGEPATSLAGAQVTEESDRHYCVAAAAQQFLRTITCRGHQRTALLLRPLASARIRVKHLRDFSSLEEIWNYREPVKLMKNLQTELLDGSTSEQPVLVSEDVVGALGSRAERKIEGYLREVNS